MAHILRAASNLKAASAIIGSLVSGGIVLVAAGGATPIVLMQAQASVLSVEGLDDVYTLTYGDNFADRLENVVITTGSGFDQSGKQVSGKSLKLDGYDAEYIGTKEVLVSYLNFSKKINVTINPKQLTTPSPTFNNANGILRWEPVTNGKTYSVVLTDPTDGHEISRDHTEGSTYDLNSVQFFTAYEVSVFASNDKKGSNGVSAFIDSDPSVKTPLKKLPNVQNLRYENGKFKWDAIAGVSSYEVHINTSTFQPTVNEISFDTTNPGEYQVSVRASAGTDDYATPNEITFRRLPTPVLSFDGTQLQAQNAENIEYYLNGEAWNGAITSITTGGDYTVTARNKANSASELESALSSPVYLTKLGKLSLNISSGKLVTTGLSPNCSAQYFVDGDSFDGDLSKVTGTGTHSITAKQVGAGNQIASELSNEVTLTKLASPIASFTGTSVDFSGKGDTFRVIVDGSRREYTEVSDELITTLSDNNVHTIAGINIGNGNDILDSDPSNEVSFVVPKINISSFYQDGMVYLRVTHSIQGFDSDIVATVKREYFKGGVKTFDNTEEIKVSKESPSVGPKNWAAGTADTVKFTVELQDIEGLQIYKTGGTATVNIP